MEAEKQVMQGLGKEYRVVNIIILKNRRFGELSIGYSLINRSRCIKEKGFNYDY